DPCQRALAWTIGAPGRRLEQVDAYGNVAHLLTLEEPHREVRIVVQGVVETSETDSRQDDGPLSHLAYLAPTALTAPTDEIRRFAARIRRPAAAPRAAAEELADAVCDAIGYRPGSSEVTDSAGAAFAKGAGVCQDQSHVFLSCARVIGIPARYVSGYLYTGDSSEAASHAWVDVWLGADDGWHSLDVTHRRPAFGGYCRLAVGRDYLDAAPVRGMRHGGGLETMETSVLVAESAQQQQ
ncbi:MAG: transglutaminase family protein, partial [Gammaproteobacteria bacterium]|nr:transglutaminase family protein [Gammaproteobacteria bacterium]